MKIALATDLHFGAGGDNPTIARAQSRFFTEVFMPYIDDRGIKDVILCGDIFDRRRSSDHATVQLACDVLFQPLTDRGIRTPAIVGNHDVYFKNTNRINSLELFASRFKNIEVIADSPVEAYPDVLLVPWITESNIDVCNAAIHAHKQRICIGHFQMEGFQLLPGQAVSQGLSRSMFRPFELCLSGHFHKKMIDGNINYLGTAYQMTWADASETKGFHVLDTDTATIEFIPNPHSTFVSVVYDNDMVLPDIQDKVVRIIVPADAEVDPVKFDDIVSKVNAGASRVSVIDNMPKSNTSVADAEVKNTVDELVEAVPEFAPHSEQSFIEDVQRDIVKLYADAHGA